MNKNEKILASKLQALKYFSDLESEECQRIAEFFSEARLKPQKWLYEAGQDSLHLFFLLEGEAELLIHLEAEDLLRPMAYLRAGDCLGIGEIFFDHYYLSAQAKTPLVYLQVQKEDFFQHILPLAPVNRRVLQDFAFMTKINTTFLYNRGARERLLLHLTQLADQAGGWPLARLDKSVTVTSLAEDLGLTREHVSRVIKQLLDQEILIKEGHQLTLNRENLRRATPL